MVDHLLLKRFIPVLFFFFSQTSSRAVYHYISFRYYNAYSLSLKHISHQLITHYHELQFVRKEILFDVQILVEPNGQITTCMYIHSLRDVLIKKQ